MAIRRNILVDCRLDGRAQATSDGKRTVTVGRWNTIGCRFDRRRILRHIGSFGAGVLVAALLRIRDAHARWPDRTIRVVVPFAAGGPPDFVARTLINALEKELGVTLYVENKPGAGGTIGVENIARAEPDGYSLLICTSAYVVNKAIDKTLPYDPISDFTPICEIAVAPNVFAVSEKLGVKSLAEFVSYARHRPGGVNYASPGIGTTPQLCSELLRVRANIPMIDIPFNSGPQVVQALLSGLVDMICSAIPLVQPHINAGTVKPLAVTSVERWRGLPNVPTMAEAGFPNFVVDTMVMLSGPARLEHEVVEKLAVAAQSALAMPAVDAALQTGGFEIVAKGPSDLADRIKRDVTMWNDIVAITNMKKS